MGKIKVLAINKKNSGSHFHRLVYGLGKLDGQLIEDKQIDITIKEFSEDIVKEIENYDIFCYHWDINIPLHELGLLQAKGVKILYSLDDHWTFSEQHPYYNNPFLRQYAENRVKSHLLLCDGVMVTTQALALDCLKYTNNVAIIPNFLSPDDFKTEKKPSEKLRVGIIGSQSHYPDWKMLKGTISRFAKNKAIAAGCEFYVMGFKEKDKYWEEVLKLFTVKKNLTVKVKQALPTDKYINLYNELDICLMPLENTHFNSRKSSLKLMECALTKTLPIGSPLYSQKELKGLVVCQENMEYEKTIEKLLDKDYYNKVLNYITEVNLRDADFSKRMEDTRAVIGALYSEDMKFKLDNVNIYSITYKDEQVGEYNTILNQNKTTGWRFEYQVFLDKLEEIKASDKEYHGVLSWKFSVKTGLPKQLLYKALHKKKYGDYNFINLSRRYWKTTKEYMDFSSKQHPKLDELLKKVLDNLGIPLTYSHDSYTYSNFFLMKKENMVDYIENWIIPSISYMEGEVWDEVNTDAEYKSGIDPEQLMESAGISFYNYLTFVLERLPMFYIYQKKLKTLNLL